MSETVQRLLKHLYQNSNNLDQWLRDPYTTTKEWSFEIPSAELNAVHTTLQFVFHEMEQIQEVRHVNQRSVIKLNEASRHNRLSFYASLGIHLLAFALGLIMLLLGIYAAFTDRMILGFVLGAGGALEIVYFLFARPLQGLNEYIGNLVQMEVALGGWFNEMAYWQVFLKDTRLEEKQSVAQAMRDATKWTIMLIEDYCSIHSKVKKGQAEDKEENDFMARARNLLENLTSRKKMPSSMGMPSENKPPVPAQSQTENKHTNITSNDNTQPGTPTSGDSVSQSESRRVSGMPPTASNNSPSNPPVVAGDARKTTSSTESKS